MRIHTNEITYADLNQATANLPGVYVDATEHGSRSHARAFEVRLEGNGSHRNSGRYGADTQEQAAYGATWDEWGAFLAYLFEVDPAILCGSSKHPVYDNGADFACQTNWRFDDAEPGHLPADTHKRHNWKYSGTPREFACNKCSAVKRYNW